MITAGPLSTTDLAAAMSASIRGDVVAAAEPSFPAAAFGATGVAPELVVVAADATDVARTVALAGRTGRRVVAQTIGRPTAVTAERTVLLVTRLLARVQVDAQRRTAAVGIGASWRQVIEAAEPFGLTALSARKDALAPRATVFAFAADRIRSFDVVTPTGAVRVVGSDHPDFYALRQGRTAPGLVVAMTLDLVPDPALMVAELTFAAADADRVLAGWPRWAAWLPRTAVTGIAVGAGDTLVIRMVQTGPAGGLRARLAALQDAVGTAPLHVSVGTATVAQAARSARTIPDRLALAA